MNLNRSRKAGHSNMAGVAGVLLAAFAFYMPSLSAQEDTGREAAVQHLRNALEQPIMEAGGFSEFDCAISSGDQPKHPFTCDAVLTEGKRMQYLLVLDPAAGLTLKMVTTLAGQLNDELPPVLDATCREFLKQLNEADWTTMHAGFNSSLQGLIPLDKLQTDLGEMRKVLGSAGEATLESYSVAGSNREELQYSVEASNAQAVFRCGLDTSQDDVTILGYLFAPYPGTPLYISGLEEDAVRLISNALDEEVVQVDIPYDQMPNAYDSAPGFAVLADGSRKEIRITRSGRHDDFNPKDYSFAVLQE